MGGFRHYSVVHTHYSHSKLLGINHSSHPNLISRRSSSERKQAVDQNQYYKVEWHYFLSFIGATRLFGSSVVGGTGQIVLDGVRCIGSESRLIDCPHNGLGNHNCDHSDDVGVRCAPGITSRVLKLDIVFTKLLPRPKL